MEEKTWLLLEEADWFFRKMVRKFVKERDKITVEGMTLPAFMILRKLEREGDQRLGDLAEEFDFTSGAITAISDKLEGGGFAVRKRPDENRRTVLLSITDKGAELLRRHSSIGLRCMTLLFEGFTEEELALQIQFYRRIGDSLEQFSATILKLAEENAAGHQAEPLQPVEEQDVRKPQRPGPADFNKYFTY